MLKLQATIRTVFGKKNQALRREGLVPACLYGHKIKNQNIQVESPKFTKIFEEAGETSLVELQIDKQKPVKVIIQDITRDVIKGNISHIDFYQIREDENLTVDVELEFIGPSKAIEEKDGILIKSLDTVEIECLPQDLIHKIEVNISTLKEFGDVIYVKDLKVPPKVKVLAHPETAVVSVAAPRSEKELEELKEKPEAAALPEAAVEKKEEGEKETTEKKGAGSKLEEKKTSEDK